MQLTFTDTQLSALKKVWIIAIILTLSHFIPGGSMIPSFVLFGCIGMIYNWEVVIKQHWDKVFINVVFYIVSSYIFVLRNNIIPYYLHLDFGYYTYQVYQILQFIIMYLISGKRKAIFIGIAAGIIAYYIADQTIIPGLRIKIGTTSIERLIGSFTYPFLFCGWLFLTENWLNHQQVKTHTAKLLLSGILLCTCLYQIIDIWALADFRYLKYGKFLRYDRSEQMLEVIIHFLLLGFSGYLIYKLFKKDKPL